MNKTKIIFGIGIVLAMLAVFTVPATMASDNEVYLVPQSSECGPGETVTVYLMANITDGGTGGMDPTKWGGFQVNITYDASKGYIADPVKNETGNPDTWDYWDWARYGDSVWVTGAIDYPGGPLGVYKIADLTIEGIDPGTTSLAFSLEAPRKSNIFDDLGGDLPSQVWTDGTFTCTGEYTISGYTTPAAADTVNITNLDKSDVVKDRPADYIGPDGFYNLTLNVPDEVEAGDTLQIVACKEIATHEHNCNVSDHDVTADEINAGGVSNVNLTLNHYCLNWMTYPYKTWEQSNWSGPAVMQMMVDHYRPEEPTQSDLNATGIAHNQGCNADLLQVDPQGMRWTLNDILHNTASYGGGKYANYGIGNYDTVERALWYICYWQYLGPGAAPTYGDYSNWMAIRGIHTSVNPKWKPQDTYDIYGFWINDPKDPGGIGENTYKSVDQWTSTYHLSLTDVRGGDSYLNRYVAICEPPEQEPGEVRLVHSKARFSGTITAAATDEELTVDVGGVPLNQLICNRKLVREKENKVVQAAIDGVNEQLAPYDRGFKKTFDGTVAGKPMPVTSDAGDYYLVPFGIASDSESDGNSVLAVVIVDSDGGKFKEASWVKEPVKYLSVTPQEALKIVYREMKGKSTIKVLKKDKATGKLKKADVIDENVDTLGDITLDETEKQRRKAYLELVYKGESPYYPVWKITIGDSVFFVDQSGTLTSGSDEPVPTPAPAPISKSIEPVPQIVE